MTAAPPRPVDAVDRAIAATNARRQTKIAARDRRDNDMLVALADVERYEVEIKAEDDRLDVLFDERREALAATMARGR